MNLSDFTRIITSFADRPSDLQFDKGRFLTEIRGELIDAKVYTRDGEYFVKEGDLEQPAILWIKNRIACLPQLADRIIDYIKVEETFVIPTGGLLDAPEYDPTEEERNVDDSIQTLNVLLDRRPAGTSSIVYLTSDAGEGKTTIINNFAVIKAKEFKNGNSNWLLLPIPLGGRPFLRFDDVVIASIVNNLRFRYFYYDSFIELVRLGLIVPAFDGFEEMFMQTSTGEALSATGSLINKLNSSGSILIAARKAYFDYKSFNVQAKLFDSIKSSVSFSKLSLKRWDRNQFVTYTQNRGIENGDEIYDLISAKLNKPGNVEHPILTRPVLVKQLIDVFNDLKDVEGLVSKMDSAIDYFPEFVNAIIDREANYKWIDTSGEPYRPILNVNEHYELLSFIAEEMWLNSTESISESVIDLISEMYSEDKDFSVQVTRQIKERVKQHALILRQDPINPAYRFDHEEFKEYFLGICIVNKLIEERILELKGLFKKALLPTQAIESSVSYIRSISMDIFLIKQTLDNVIYGENQFSYVKENAGNLLMRLLNKRNDFDINVSNYEFPTNSLWIVSLKNIRFQNCHFQSSLVKSSNFTNCSFINCQFDRLEIDKSTSFEATKFSECEISIAYDLEKERGYYDIYTIESFLKSKGIIYSMNDSIYYEEKVDEIVFDEELEIAERALRKFIRSNNPVNDDIFKLRLGNGYEQFIRRIVPDLLRFQILEELEYAGKGQKRRFKLGVSFGKIEAGLAASKGNYQAFLNTFKTKK
jgi:hypothetical protein